MTGQGKKMKTLILGIGNPILADDGVGIKIVQKLREKNPELEVVETCESGIALLEHVADCDKLILIDSIKTGKGKPGELYKLKLEDLNYPLDFASFHGVDIATAFELGQKLGIKLPRHISIYAVEVKDNATFAEECTEEVKERIPFIVEQIIEEEKL